MLNGTVWITGLPGAGKTTLARALQPVLAEHGVAACILDGDDLRAGVCADLGFDPGDRAENVRRIAELARLLAAQGMVVIVALVSPFERARARARRIHDEAGLPFVLVHADAPARECERRDPKGLYRLARRGELSGLTGVSAPYERPTNVDVCVRGRAPDVVALEVLGALAAAARQAA